MAIFIITLGEVYSQTTEFAIYPNPFSDIATIQFDLTQSDTITLKVL